MNTVRVRFSRFIPWVMGAGLTGLLSACGSPGVPTVAAPSLVAPGAPNLPAQSWLDAPRIPAPAGVHQAAFGNVPIGATQTTILALLKMSGQPDNVAFEMDSCPTHTRWTLSTDANTLTRQFDCNGTAQFAVLHRATPSSYIGYHSTLYSNGTVSFGPFRMTRRYADQTGLSPEWVAEWADSPQSNNSGPVGITTDGSQVGCPTLKFSFVDAESQLERLGNCGSGATAASLSRVNTSTLYTGFYVGFDAADVPTGLGAFAMRRPAGAGLSGTWSGNWGGATVQGATKTSITVDGQGVEGCTQWKLSGDSSTLFRDFSSCGNSEGVAELHRMPGINTYAGFYSHYDKVAKQFSMGPFQVKLSNLTLPGDPPLTAGVTWNPNTRLLHKSSGLSLSSYAFDDALNCARFDFTSSTPTGNTVLGRVGVGSLIASDTDLKVGGPYLKVNQVLARTATTLSVCGQDVALNSFVAAGKLDLSEASATAWNSSVQSMIGQAAYNENYIPGQTRIIGNPDSLWDDQPSAYNLTSLSAPGGSLSAQSALQAQATTQLWNSCPTKAGSANTKEEVRKWIFGNPTNNWVGDKATLGKPVLCSNLGFADAKIVLPFKESLAPIPGGTGASGRTLAIEFTQLNANLLGIQGVNNLTPPNKLPNFTSPLIGTVDQTGLLVLGRAGFETLQLGFRPRFDFQVTPTGLKNNVGFQFFAKGKLQLEGLAAGLWLFQVPDTYLKVVPVMIPTPLGPFPTTIKPGLLGYPIVVGKGGFAVKKEFEVTLSSSLNDPFTLGATSKPVTTQFGSQSDNMSLIGVTLEPVATWEIGTLGAFLKSSLNSPEEKVRALTLFKSRILSGLSPTNPIKSTLFPLINDYINNADTINRLLSKGLISVQGTFRLKTHAKLFSLVGDDLKAQGIAAPRPILNLSSCWQPLVRVEVLPSFPLPITFEGTLQGQDTCTFNKGYSWVEVQGSSTQATSTGASNVTWQVKSTSERSDIPGAADIVQYLDGGFAPNFAVNTVETVNIYDAWLNAATRRRCLLYKVDKVADDQNNVLTKFNIRNSRVVAQATGAACNAPQTSAVTLASGEASALYRVIYFSEFSTGNEAYGKLAATGTLNPEGNLITGGVFGVWGYKDIPVSKTPPSIPLPPTGNTNFDNLPFICGGYSQTNAGTVDPTNPSGTTQSVKMGSNCNNIQADTGDTLSLVTNFRWLQGSGVGDKNCGLAGTFTTVTIGAQIVERNDFATGGYDVDLNQLFSYTSSYKDASGTSYTSSGSTRAFLKRWFYGALTPEIRGVNADGQWKILRTKDLPTPVC